VVIGARFSNANNVRDQAESSVLTPKIGLRAAERSEAPAGLTIIVNDERSAYATV
jgi:hypothetical protein